MRSSRLHARLTHQWNGISEPPPAGLGVQQASQASVWRCGWENSPLREARIPRGPVCGAGSGFAQSQSVGTLSIHRKTGSKGSGGGAPKTTQGASSYPRTLVQAAPLARVVGPAHPHSWLPPSNLLQGTVSWLRCHFLREVSPDLQDEICDPCYAFLTPSFSFSYSLGQAQLNNCVIMCYTAASPTRLFACKSRKLVHLSF